MVQWGEDRSQADPVPCAEHCEGKGPHELSLWHPERKTPPRAGDLENAATGQWVAACSSTGDPVLSLQVGRSRHQRILQVNMLLGEGYLELKEHSQPAKK